MARKQFNVGDKFVLMEFDTFVWKVTTFPDKDGRLPRKEFVVIHCIVEGIESTFTTDKNGNITTFLIYKMFASKQTNGWGGYYFTICTNDGKSFWSNGEKDESKPPKYNIVLLGKDLAELKRNITNFSKSIIEKLKLLKPVDSEI